MNTIAHGYAIGFKTSKKRQKSFLNTLFKSEPRTEERIISEVGDVLKAYVKNKNMVLSWSDLALIRASLTIGFVKGYQDAQT